MGEGEAPLRIPPGMKVVGMAPAPEKLDPRNEASDVLVGATIVTRIADFGWCVGKLEKKNTNGSRKIKGVMVNFIAKFEIDECMTDLALEATEYDPSPDAAYESWLLLEPEEGGAE